MTEFENIIKIGAGGLPVANSVDVARVLGRAHKNILKSLRRLSEQNPGLGINPATPPKGSRKAYEMTEEGFIALTSTLPGVEEETEAVRSQFKAAREAIIEVIFDDIDKITSQERTEGQISAIPCVGGGIIPPEQLKPLERKFEAVDVPSLESRGNLELSPEVALPISTHPNLERVVDARRLWEFINGATDFAMWFKRRVEHCFMVEGVDYVVMATLSNKLGKSEAVPAIGRPRNEYALTIDAAKELCMVEGGTRGKQARQYFIEIEKRYMAIPAFRPQIPHTFAEALRLAADQQEKIEEQTRMLAAQTKALTDIQAIVEANTPKVEFANKVQQSRAITVRTFAHILASKGINIGEIRLFAWLRDSGYLCNNNEPTQAAIEMGLFDMVAKTVDLPNGTVKAYTQTLVTGKGQVYFLNRLMYDRQNQNGDEQG